ncbi:MAG: ABC transporter ATP-binding protein [Pseudomonadota bacterium]
MTAPSHAVLSVAGVSKRFGGLVAIDDLEFEVSQHEMVGIIGPNGSGKTTMMNLISGALKPSLGTITLHGRRIENLPPQTISRLGVGRTFQLVRLLPSLTVIENVKAGAVFGYRQRWGTQADQFAQHMLQRVGLESAGNTPITSLTYIDQKRVELARALAGEPNLLLLDEWLAGLNPTELQTGIELIHALRDEGRTVILVEHVMDAIRSLCDRCVVMASGGKIAEGSPDTVLADPDVVRAYLGDDDAHS